MLWYNKKILENCYLFLKYRYCLSNIKYLYCIYYIYLVLNKAKDKAKSKLIINFNLDEISNII